ncbi:chromosome segregation protein SMC [Candidatus Woesearchaeota archaeon]|nr:chromosome segregation protein SMC [Candidatus Woesearchaeota archaeon]
MTKINRIAIHGFKSFAHKTEIPFDGKFNVILGPNGSGKSNVGDALCFVLGRLSAKSMRAEKAVNLIFNGAKTKKPASAASVEIAFDNSSKIFPDQAPEAVINRTVTQNGNSIYRINGKKRTRTEVLDFLGAAKINPEGYNIILQGDITRFVDMPAIERRQIIEEISDVTAYEEKKHKALLELQKVEEQLNNAEIILKERSVYLKELKKDRDQALKFKELKDRIDSNKATAVHFQMQEKEQQKAKLDAEISQFQQKITKAEQDIEKIKQNIAVQKQKLTQINQDIERRGEKEQLQVHRGIEDLKVSLAENKTRISTLKDEINKIQQRKDQFQQELEELAGKTSSSGQKVKELQFSVKRKQKEQQDIDASIAQFKGKHKIESSQELEQEMDAKDRLIEQKQEKVNELRQKQQEILRDKDKAEFQLGSIDERIKKVKEIEQQSKKQLQELQQKKGDFKAATLRLNQCLDKDSSFASQLSNAKKKIAEAQEKEVQLNARTLSLQAGLASNQALQSIARQKIKGVYGTIAELGNAQAQYSLPLETTAGPRMQHLVVDTDATAAECIKFLQSSKGGSASFIPLNKIKSADISVEDKKLLKQDGVHDFALNLLSFKPQFRKAFEYVFGNTLVVENIDVARKVGIGRIKMATMDGNLAEGSGVMKGGFLARKQGLGFREKDSLEKLEVLEKETAALEGVLANVQLQREANEQEISVLRTQRAELEAAIITLEKTLHLDDADLNATASLKKELTEHLASVEKEVAAVQNNITAINKELAELKSAKQSLRSQVSNLRDPRLLAQLHAFEESRQSCREDILRLEAELKNSALQMEQMLTPEQEKIREILKQHEKEEAQFTKEIKELSSRVAQKEKELERQEQGSKEFYAKYKESFVQREQINTAITKAENEIESIREKSRGQERELNVVSLKNAEIKAKLAGLQEEFGRYKNVELFKDRSPEQLQQEINKFESMLTQMSAVNMKALEVYEQVEKEYTKLVDKREGLVKEKTDVLTLMNEIETKKKDHFMKTFTTANEHFQRIFASLFKKGKAYLQLDNPNNPFDDGLSIKVKLTGNRFMDIKSLSGGEKTLTALSLIFAIQEYQPSSFYILDEVDAALDKHNSQTLAQLIRSYAEQAQYILISHNDSMISEADTLFGVSMSEEGVSKVTSLKI